MKIIIIVVNRHNGKNSISITPSDVNTSGMNFFLLVTKALQSGMSY